VGTLGQDVRFAIRGLRKAPAFSLAAIRASDPLTLLAAIVLVVAIAIVAMMIPAWRASRLSPAAALRTE
jgi:ABC-type antimicrobial peptide transport system permease subunit